MKLGKLLSAGKSFFGGGGKVTYRQDKRYYLPKFNSGQNPFVAKEPAAGENLNKVLLPAAVENQKISVPKVVSPARPIPTWKEKLNPFRAPEPPSAATAPTVQAELSLETVKVVHNDLTDADIEVVPVKSRGNVMPEVPVLPPTREAWEFMGERLVKSL